MVVSIKPSKNESKTEVLYNYVELCYDYEKPAITVQLYNRQIINRTNEGN